jgi:hypothetical protein
MPLVLGLMLGVGAQSNAYGPVSVQNLAFWADPSQSSTVTLNSSDVSAVRDLSGNSRNLSQGTAANQPAYVTGASGINNRGAINFTGANNDALPLTNALALDRNSAGFTCLAVINLPTLGGVNHRIFTILTSAGAGMFAIDVLTTRAIQTITRRVAADGASVLSSTALVTAATPTLVAVSVNYATGSVIITIDGTSRTQTASWTTGAASDDANHQVAPIVGCQSTNLITGLIGEVVCYRSALSAAAIDTLRTNYFKPKWGTS